MYDIKTKRIIDITPDTGGVRIKGKDYDTGADTGRYPDISGNYIVYWKTMDDPQIRVHGRGGEYAGIYAYDIASRTHGLVVRLPSGNSEEEKRPVVYASGRTMTVIWRNNGILCAGKIWI
jgi:hypothetical protein